MIHVDFETGLICLTGIVMVLFALWCMADNGKRERYQRPKVTCARVHRGVGEFEVESSHSEHLIREMNLPPNAKIHIMQRNSNYLVRFTLPAKQTPDFWKAKVWSEAGEESEALVWFEQTQADRAYVQDWAQTNGYQGPIEER